MRGDPQGYILTSCMDYKTLVDWHFEHDAFLKLNELVCDLLREMKVLGKVRCGSIVHLTDEGTYIVKTKVIVRGEHFYHEEPWGDFPSDHFKTRILLVTGGA